MAWCSVWRSVAYIIVMFCGMVWCSVEYCGVMWCSLVWSGMGGQRDGETARRMTAVPSD